ncbi:unnamed protein product [Polarella glacialis]|uniref:Amino acid transporter transmembrane domain-containing protein n=1 Tax=Polarella glacialis TaxID=89957 RepID=A0A813K751_POLGL|nr:unnamed protein product [Polarella glacialis]
MSASEQDPTRSSAEESGRGLLEKQALESLEVTSVALGASSHRDKLTAESKSSQSLAFGGRTIGFWSGVMLLMNNLAGPTISLMPPLAQEAGWLSMVLVMLTVGVLSMACGVMLVCTMERMPDYNDSTKRIEFTDIIRFYVPGPWDSFLLIIYHSYLILTLMSYIIQSAQILDYVAMDIFGCTTGVSLGKGLLIQVHTVCGSANGDSVSPFGEMSVLPLSMILVAIVCVPFAVMNLDDNVTLQWIAIAGLTVLAALWIQFLVEQPDFPQPLPLVTTSQQGLIGTVLFNFAFMSAIPSWVNEKKTEVGVKESFASALGYVIVVYTAIGVVGGMAFQPFFATDQNLFSKLNSSGLWTPRATVAVYPVLQNFTSIPVLSILIRYNLQSSGWSSCSANFLAFAFPWVLSIPFYSGQGFDRVATIGGLATSSVINFAVPALVYSRSSLSC